MRQAATPAAQDAGPRVVVGKLHRVQRGHGQAFSREAPAVTPAPARQPARVAIMLALAHKIQFAIDRGEVRDRAEAARRLGVTRARVTQLLDLTLLAPQIQDVVLGLEAVDGVEPASERFLRTILRHERWAEQSEVWGRRSKS